MSEIVNFPTEPRRQVELFRAWKAARAAGNVTEAELIWVEFLTVGIPPEQREAARELAHRYGRI